jgi:hypothetical protein
VEFVVYFILGVWLYATYFAQPFDPPSDVTTWVRFALLTLTGLVVPLVMSRPFHPSALDDVRPSDENTASLLSAYTFTFLDPIVYHANRVGNVTPDDMPEISESEKIEILSKRVFKSLEPVQRGKRNSSGAHHECEVCVMISSELDMNTLFN